MQIALTCFGNDPKYTRLLDLWLEHYWKSGCKLPLYILTNMECVLPKHLLLPGMTVLRVDTEKHAALIRAHCPFDIKGVLILEALLQLSRCVIMDIDALLLKDPTERLNHIGDTSFAMGLDGGNRDIPGCNWKEHNAGVMYFGNDSVPMRQAIITAYTSAYHELRARTDAGSLEQMAWSLVWHRMNALGQAKLLPMALNWSRFWPACPATVVLHEHGEKKWAKYNLGDKTHVGA